MAEGARWRREAARVGEEGGRGSWAAAGWAEGRRRRRQGARRRGRERFRGGAVLAAVAAAAGAAVGAMWMSEAAGVVEGVVVGREQREGSGRAAGGQREIRWGAWRWGHEQFRCSEVWGWVGGRGRRCGTVGV